MSRAGCEPGYKKTNQDNCFAFEKYITEDQALFGAMDGHGPNGEHSVCDGLGGCSEGRGAPSAASHLIEHHTSKQAS